jgi:hypothetical protein
MGRSSLVDGGEHRLFCSARRQCMAARDCEASFFPTILAFHRSLRKRGSLGLPSALLGARWIDQSDEFLNRLLVLAHQFQAGPQFRLSALGQFSSLGLRHLLE